MGLVVSIGEIIGGVFGHYLYMPIRQFMSRSWVNGIGSKLAVVSVVLYVVIVILMYTISVKSDFSNWDPSFHFQLGNEATLTRPWLGKIYLVAVYDTVLSERDILQNFKAGPDGSQTHRRIGEGLIALYTFQEGKGELIYDQSGVGPPMDLRIQNPEHIRWLEPNGIEIVDNTIISSDGPFKKIYDSVGYVNSNLTMEVWVDPSNTQQQGPARIISYSKEPTLVNFILGQEKQNVVFRLRTPLAGPSGTQPEIYTKDKPLQSTLQHIAVTFRPGYETIYYNGTEHLMQRVAKKQYLFLYLEYILGKYVYSFFVLFPLGFISYLGFSVYANSKIVSGILALLVGGFVLGVIWLVPMYTTWMRGMDLWLFGFGGIVLVLSILVSETFRKTLPSI